MKIVDSTFWLIKLPFYPVWVLITLSLYIFAQIIQMCRNLFSDSIRRVVYYLKQESLLAQTVRFVFELVGRFWNWIRLWANRIKSQKEINRISFFRTRRNEEQIAEMLERAEANPNDITEDQKVLYLMQKMKKLQQLVFQQSSDRRKAQSQLHEIKNQLTKKNAILIKERSESVQNLQRINLLNLQLRQKNQSIEKQKAYVQELKQEIQNMKKALEQKQNQKSKQKKVQRQDSGEEEKEKKPIMPLIIQKDEQKIEQIFEQKQTQAYEVQKNQNEQSNDNEQNGEKKEYNNNEKQNQQEIENEYVKKTTTKKKKKKFVANN